MKVRAVAAATAQSNAIGSLELECTPQGLAIVYLGVGAFSEGYVTALRTQNTQSLIPWSKVESARTDGSRVFLVFDKSGTPHHRLTLTHFQVGERTHRAEIPRRRLVWRLAIAAAMVAALLGSFLILSRLRPDRAAAATLLIGGGFALVLLFVGVLAEPRIAEGSDDPDVTRELFLGEFALYFPHLARGAETSVPKRARRPINVQGLLPRTTAAIVITLSASALAAILVGRWVVGGEHPTANVERVAPSKRGSDSASREPLENTQPAEAAPAVTVAPPNPIGAAVSAGETASAAAPRPGAATVLGPCECARGDAALWQDPIPKLSILLLSSKVTKKERTTTSELEVAVVNNSDKPLSDLTLVVNFFERDESPARRRHLISTRPLFYEGPLLPGKAIKWSTEAEGSEFQIENPIAGNIGMDGEGAAPLSRFVELLDAVHRPVRLHGAMMLAYFRDPGAREAALKLKDALREDESPYLNRVLQALSTISVCGLDVSKEGPSRRAQACVFNAADAPAPRLALRVRALKDAVDHRRPVGTPPELVTEATWAIPGELAPKKGVRLEAWLDLGRGAAMDPQAFEALADREDLLP